MNITNAIKTLADGQAARPSTWRGYVERVDKDIDDPTYSQNIPYDVGQYVQHNGSRYVCTIATGEPGPFDSSKWTRIDADRYIVFVDADDSTHYANPSAVYYGQVGMSNDDISWSRLGPTSEIPAEVLRRHPDWVPDTATGAPFCPTPGDMPDRELFVAILADTWTTGSSSDFETQRTGGGDRRW